MAKKFETRRVTEVLLALLSQAGKTKRPVWLLAILVPPLAYATPLIRDNWVAEYPASQSDENAAASGSVCVLCHSASSTSEWNAYGWALRGNGQNFGALEGTDSDTDPNTASNLDEINAGTQPGWTDGANNSVFDAGGLINSNASPPAGIGGTLDPAPNSPPQGEITTPADPVTQILPGQSVNFTATASDPENDPLTHLWTFGAGSGAADSNVEDPGNIIFNNPGVFVVSYTVDDGEFTATDTRTIIVAAPEQEITLDYDLFSGSLTRRIDTPDPAEDTFLSGPISFAPVTMMAGSNRLRITVNFRSPIGTQDLLIEALGTGPNRPETFASRIAGDCADGINACSHDFGPGIVFSNSAGDVGNASSTMALNIELINATGTFGGGFVNPFDYTEGTGVHGANPLQAPFACSNSPPDQCTVGAQFPDFVDGQDSVSFQGIVLDVVFGNSAGAFAPVTVDTVAFNLLGANLQSRGPQQIPTLNFWSLLIFGTLLLLVLRRHLVARH